MDRECECEMEKDMVREMKWLWEKEGRRESE